MGWHVLGRSVHLYDDCHPESPRYSQKVHGSNMPLLSRRGVQSLKPGTDQSTESLVGTLRLGRDN